MPIELVFSAVVTLSTLVYAVLTWRLVRETSRLRKAQTEPKVSIQAQLSSRTSHGGIEIAIRNEGQGPATNIVFEFEGDETYFENSISETHIIRNGIEYLGAGRDFIILIGYLSGNSFQRATADPWRFRVSYQNAVGDKKEDQYLIDFSQFKGFIIGMPPLIQIAKAIEELSKGPSTVQRICRIMKRSGRTWHFQKIYGFRSLYAQSPGFTKYRKRPYG